MLRLTNTPESATWLDLLPEEVCDRIAQHVTGGAQTDDALQLALTSRKQTRAVKSSIGRSIYLYFGEDDKLDNEAARWASVFDEFSITVCSSSYPPFVADLFRKGNVTEADICASDSDLVMALCQSSTVRKLSLTISCQTDLCQLFAKLLSLPLEELFLRERFRSFDDLVLLASACASYVPSFDRLTSFRWFDGNALSDESRSYWHAVSLLPTFTKIYITAPPPESMFSTLSRFENITIADMYPNMFTRLGSALVGYEDYAIHRIRPLNVEDLMELTKCTRLENLNIHVDESVQNLLVEAVSRLPCLEEIDLSFKGRDAVIELNPGVMLGIVRGSPKLRELGIRGGRVPLSEWEPILTYASDKLELLTIELRIRGAEMCEMLLKILPLLPRLCKNMEMFGVLSPIPREQLPGQELVEKVLHTARRVQMALPKLDHGNLEKYAVRLFSVSSGVENESDVHSRSDLDNSSNVDNGSDVENGYFPSEEEEEAD